MSEVLPFFEKFSTHSFVFLRSRGSDIWGSDQIIAAERGIIWAKASMTHRVSDLEVYVSKSLPLNVEQLAKHTPKNFYAYRTFLRGTVGNCSQVSAFHFSGSQIITMSAKEQREGLESEVTQLFSTKWIAVETRDLSQFYLNLKATLVVDTAASVRLKYESWKYYSDKLFVSSRNNNKNAIQTF